MKKILSIRVLKVVLILVGWTIWGRSICETVSPGSYFWCMLIIFEKANIKVSKKENRFTLLRKFIKKNI